LPRSKTSSFVTTIPLIVDSQTECELLSRFQAARQLYNACLGEAMVRMNLVRNSWAYKQAKNLPKAQKKQRTQAFNNARITYRYSEYELHSYATIVSQKSKWIADKLDSNTQQTLASRAFRTSEKVWFGFAKKVRYKVPARFKSVEGKTNKQGIRWINNQLVWGKLKVNAIIDSSSPIIQHGLSSKIKYVRLLWKELNGKRRWYVQLINEGLPYQKPQNYVSSGVVGLDLNISNIAFVADNQAGLLALAGLVADFAQEITKLQRKLQRSQRATNPNNYEKDFKSQKGRKTVVKKGKNLKDKRQYNKSKAYLKTAKKKRNLERKKSAYVKSQNQRLVNEILRHGNQIKTEKVSVKAWQKRYGKAISSKAPGFFQFILKRKAESANGSFTMFSTQKTALSQTHLDGSRTRKKLSERIHYDATGIVMHRDLMSAYLSRFVNEEDTLLLHLAVEQWEESEPILVQAWKKFQINCEQVTFGESRLTHSPSEQFCTKLRKVTQISQEGLKDNFSS
jgi:putative transposase